MTHMPSPKAMQEAVQLIVAHGYSLEQVGRLKNEEWRKLLHDCMTEEVRECVRAWHWTHGSVRKLRAARNRRAHRMVINRRQRSGT